MRLGGPQNRSGHTSGIKKPYVSLKVSDHGVTILLAHILDNVCCLSFSQSTAFPKLVLVHVPSCEPELSVKPCGLKKKLASVRNIKENNL
jgi:hypothetical protein